jgi:CHAD domain-containing protein
MKANRFHLRHGEPVRQWLTRTVTGLNGAVQKRIQRSKQASPETIHEIRVATKKLRALLRLLRPVISAKTFARENTRLKTAAAGFAHVRDHQIARETLAALIEDCDPGHGRELLRRLKKTAAPAARCSVSDLRDAGGRLEISCRVLPVMRLAATGWEAISPGLTETYRRCRKRLKKALGDPRAETFHQWRIPVKHLYYQLQWLELLWPSCFTRMIKRLHKLETMLGEDHDLSVMEGLVLPLAEGDDGSLKKAARKRSHRLRSRGGSLGKKLFHDSPGKFSKHCRHHCP